jgi:hypothetical protein
MDVGQKRALVRQWFKQYCQDYGFDVTRVDESPLLSGMTLTIGKQSFPGIESQIAISDTLLKSMSPRELLNVILPQRGMDLSGAWSRSLRQARTTT